MVRRETASGDAMHVRYGQFTEPHAITCTDGRGDAPIEDWHPEDGDGTTPFDIGAINKRLAALLGVPNG
ncbi:hypothetical protein ACQP2P_01925 [Dactylosporangium sp. CA-139114]|uniref:hypothetical protein n=1 Tax=Dactylosporangium sp. CA-139114 TaxID=3239931 RepID=UPI003D96B7D5